MSRSQLRHAVARGRYLSPVTGAYVAAGLASPRGRRDYYPHPEADALWRALAAAAAVMPPGAALADDSAAHVWCGWWPRTLTPRIVVPTGTAPPRRRGLAARTAELDPSGIVTVCGLPVTPAARTAADLARRLPRPWALAALDAFGHAGLVTAAAVDQELAAVRGGRGLRQARELLNLTDPGAASPGESLARLHLLEAGLGPVETQVPLLGGTYRADLRVRGVVLVEFEGSRHDDPDGRVADRHRFNELARLPGIAVVRVGWSELRRPAVLVGQVRSALRGMGQAV